MKQLLYIILLIGVYTASYAQNRQVIQMELEEEGSVKKKHSRMAMKINPLLFFRGDIPVYLESTLTDKISFEVGVGITLTDYIFELSRSNYEELDLDSRTGYSYRLGFRYYASDYSFEPVGVYFALEHRHQTYNSTLVECGDIKNISKDLSRKNNDFRLTIGYMNVFEENVFFEPYAGFGLRNRSYNEITCTDTDYSIENENDMVPYLSLGFKVGIIF
jgi:hypothetical protein